MFSLPFNRQTPYTGEYVFFKARRLKLQPKSKVVLFIKRDFLRFLHDWFVTQPYPSKIAIMLGKITKYSSIATNIINTIFAHPA